MLGIGLVFLRELTDNTVKTDDYVEQATGWTTLGHVNTFSKHDLVVKTPLPRAQTAPVEPPHVQPQEMKRTRRRV